MEIKDMVLGAKVIANKKASYIYPITKEGFKGIICKIHEYPGVFDILGEDCEEYWHLDPEYFDIDN